jgi:hypothetical protein
LTDEQRHHATEFMKWCAYTPFFIWLFPVAVGFLAFALLSWMRLISALRREGTPLVTSLWAGFNFAYFGLYVAASSFPNTVTRLFLAPLPFSTRSNLPFYLSTGAKYLLRPAVLVAAKSLVAIATYEEIEVVRWGARRRYFIRRRIF